MSGNNATAEELSRILEQNKAALESLTVSRVRAKATALNHAREPTERVSDDDSKAMIAGTLGASVVVVESDLARGRAIAKGRRAGSALGSPQQLPRPTQSTASRHGEKSATRIGDALPAATVLPHPSEHNPIPQFLNKFRQRRAEEVARERREEEVAQARDAMVMPKPAPLPPPAQPGSNQGPAKQRESERLREKFSPENTMEERRRNARETLKASVRKVQALLQEYKALVLQVSSLSASAKTNGTVFWCAQNFQFNDQGERTAFLTDAMLTAQSLARQIGGATVEQTRAGASLDYLYTFNELKERFKVIYSHVDDETIKKMVQENEQADAIRQRLDDMVPEDAEEFHRLSSAAYGSSSARPRLSEGELQAKVEQHKMHLKRQLCAVVRHAFTDALGEEGLRKKIGDEIAYGQDENQHLKSAAGTLWDIISQHYAAEVSGVVSAVHAVPYDFTQSKRDIWMKTTFMRVEKDQIITRMKGGKVPRLVQFFLDGVLLVTSIKDGSPVETQYSSLDAYKTQYPECDIQKPEFKAPDMERLTQEGLDSAKADKISETVNKMTGEAVSEDAQTPGGQHDQRLNELVDAIMLWKT